MFKRTIDDYSIAKQITLLLNKNNKLTIRYQPEDILHVKDTYIVETIGEIVIGCIQVEKQSYIMSELKHLVVHPDMRKRGIAKNLVLAGIKKSITPLLYATIRQDNIASLNTFKFCKFLCVGKYTTGNRNILLHVITCPKWDEQVYKTEDCACSSIR